MTPTQLLYWLQGYMDAAEGKLTKTQSDEMYAKIQETIKRTEGGGTITYSGSGTTTYLSGHSINN